VIDKLPLKRQAEARSLLTKIPYAETREEAERQKCAFQAWCTKRGHAEVGRTLDRDWDRMVTFLLIAEKTFRRLDAPELLADVASGVYVNGVRVMNQRDAKTAA
jgi:hypothetical protein